MIEAYITETLGSLLLVSRLAPRSLDQSETLGEWPRVSIIIPARNEEENLPVLLDSLANLDYPNFEVIVVDDHSTDKTSTIAASFKGVKVLPGAPRPLEWTGKSWACYQGALIATGDLLLFTDADTFHNKDSLKRAVATLERKEFDLLSCLPYHMGKSWWEKLSGPFHMLLIAMTAPFNEPKPRRVFAIGQYLLFRRTSYHAIGGHSSIKSDLVDDLAIARKVIESGFKHHVFRGSPLFQVRMYRSLSEFIAGWRRNFRLGFAYSHPLSGLEATLMIMAITGAGHLMSSWYTTLLALLCLLFMALFQSKLGRFSPLGVIFWPFSLALFCLTAGLALTDLLTKKDVSWKGRLYAPPLKQP